MSDGDSDAGDGGDRFRDPAGSMGNSCDDEVDVGDSDSVSDTIAEPALPRERFVTGHASSFLDAVRIVSGWKPLLCNYMPSLYWRFRMTRISRAKRPTVLGEELGV